MSAWSSAIRMRTGLVSGIEGLDAYRCDLEAAVLAADTGSRRRDTSRPRDSRADAIARRRIAVNTAGIARVCARGTRLGFHARGHVRDVHGLPHAIADRHDPAPRVLVADDQPDVLEALRWLLTGEGYEPQFVSSTDAVMERLRAEPFDLLLMDLNYTRDTTSGREGLELIPRVRAHDPALPIVVMTGWGSIDTAVEAMRRGAKSFVQKPWEDVTLLEILEREIAEARAARRRDHKQQREFEDARLIQRGLLPTSVPQVAGIDLAVAWQPADGVGGDCFDTLAFGSGARRLDRRHRRQGPAGGAADVEPAGGRPRLRAGVGRPVVRLRQRQPPAVPQHGERPVRDVLLRAHRRGRTPDRLLERRPQSAAADPRAAASSSA